MTENGNLRELPGGMAVYEQEGEPALYRVPIPDSPVQEARNVARAAEAGMVGGFTGASVVTPPAEEREDTSSIVSIVPRPATPNMQAGGKVPGRRMGRRIVRIRIDTDEYPDFQADVWVNMPEQHITEMQEWTRDLKNAEEDGISEEEKAARLAATEAVKQKMAQRYHDLMPWTNFVDWEGNPYPATDDPAFMEQVPGDLVQLIMAERQKQVGKLTPLKKTR